MQPAGRRRGCESDKRVAGLLAETTNSEATPIAQWESQLSSASMKVFSFVCQICNRYLLHTHRIFRRRRLLDKLGQEEAFALLLGWLKALHHAPLVGVEAETRPSLTANPR